MKPLVENSFWASFPCSNSANYIKVSDDIVIGRMKDRFAEIIDTGNGAIVIVEDTVIHRCAVIDEIEAKGQASALGGEREQKLKRPYCFYQNVIERERDTHLTPIY